MPFVLLLMAAAIIAGTFSAVRLWKKAGSTAEKSLLTRIGLFVLAAVLFGAALLCRLPLRYLLLTLPPLFFVLVISQQIFNAARRRVRSNRTPDIERMKRLN